MELKELPAGYYRVPIIVWAVVTRRNRSRLMNTQLYYDTKSVETVGIEPESFGDRENVEINLLYGDIPKEPEITTFLAHPWTFKIYKEREGLPDAPVAYELNGVFFGLDFEVCKFCRGE